MEQRSTNILKRESELAFYEKCTHLGVRILFIHSFQMYIELPTAVVGDVLSIRDLKMNRRPFFTAISALLTPANCVTLSEPLLLCLRFLACET